MTPPRSGQTVERPPARGTHVLGLVGVVLATLIAFSAFFIGFLLAPLAILLFFSLIFYARNRSGAGKGKGKGKPVTEAEPGTGARSRLIAEARARQAELALEERRSRSFVAVPTVEDGESKEPEDVSDETE
jgi:hypothetical protein